MWSFSSTGATVYIRTVNGREKMVEEREKTTSIGTEDRVRELGKCICCNFDYFLRLDAGKHVLLLYLSIPVKSMPFADISGLQSFEKS